MHGALGHASELHLPPAFGINIMLVADFYLTIHF
jgi:hypothetical protein